MGRRVLHHASPICKHLNFQRAKDRHLMTHITRPLLYGAAFLLLGAVGGADRFAGMDAYVSEAMKKGKSPGCQLPSSRTEKSFSHVDTACVSWARTGR